MSFRSSSVKKNPAPTKKSRPLATRVGDERRWWCQNREKSAGRRVRNAWNASIASGDRSRSANASPSIRMQFRDAPTFMKMVRHLYPMLVRATATVFFRPDPVEQGAMQQVHLRDPDGRSWRATYHLQRQPDKNWLINGCVVGPDQSDSLI